ncbi:hypothetical protein HYX14_04300 [Candidatus Woesearchaeota archaeon]|nr:hypothetical protein [Candidatus Woesearchaeota archaeon]
MLDQDKILNFLRVVGPTIPGKVAKNIKSEILIASAHLSDLVSQGKVKVSNLKIGGTPLYYLPGQEEQLYHFAAGNLNPKDFQVLERLRQEKVVREADVDLLSKVALRQIKDFAVPLQVTVQGKTELFWKWHLLSRDEIGQRIGEILGLKEVPKEEPKVIAEAPQERLEVPQEQIKEEPAEIPSPEISRQETLTQKVPEIPSKEETKPKVRRKRKIEEEELLPEVHEFLKKLNIAVEQQETVRKNAELNLLVKVPSVLGRVTYFCKVKNKGRCDEKDLASAYMEAQIKKLPLLFLYSNEMHKKALEMVGSGAFENIILRKME